VQAAEEDADVKPICLIRQVECGGIQAGIGPVIVSGKLSKLVDGHRHIHTAFRTLKGSLRSSDAPKQTPLRGTAIAKLEFQSDTVQTPTSSLLY